MSKKSSDDSITKKYAKLTNVAVAANIFAWIIFIIHIFLVWATYAEAQNVYMSQAIAAGQNPDFTGMLKENLYYSANMFFDLLGIFVRGIVYALVLKGISVGLYTILETKLNKKTANETSEPVFYKPQDVLWLQKWINRAAIVVIGITAVISMFEFSRIKGITSAYFINQPRGDVSASIAAGVLIALNIILVSVLYYFLLRSLSSALSILMEVEFNSRHAKR